MSLIVSCDTCGTSRQVFRMNIDQDKGTAQFFLNGGGNMTDAQLVGSFTSIERFQSLECDACTKAKTALLAELETIEREQRKLTAEMKEKAKAAWKDQRQAQAAGGL